MGIRGFNFCDLLLCRKVKILLLFLCRKPADIWSAGILLHLLVSGTLPFLGTKDRLYNQILEAKIDLSGPLWENHIGPDVKDLIRSMLQFSPEKRLTIQQVLAHPWLKVGCSFA